MQGTGENRPRFRSQSGIGTRRIVNYNATTKLNLTNDRRRKRAWAEGVITNFFVSLKQANLNSRNRYMGHGVLSATNTRI